MPPPYGGISKWTEELSQYLRDDAIILENLDTAVRWRSVHNKSVILRIGFGSIHAAFLIAKLVITLINFSPAVVHLNSSGSFGLARDLVFLKICRIFRVKTVLHLRFGRVPELRGAGGWEWYIFRKCFYNSGTVISIDKSTESFLKKSFPDDVQKVCYIPNFINLSRSDFFSLQKGQKDLREVVKISYVGWVIPSKGVEDLLSSILLLSDINFVVSFTGPVSESYLRYLKSKYFQVEMKFLGSKNNEEAIKDISNSDIFVLASHSEGFPNVVLEAMAVRVPIVATRVGAIPEILGGGAGAVVNVQDIAGLAEAIFDVVNDRDVRENMVSLSYNRVQTLYSIENIVHLYKDIWLSEV